MLTRTSGPPPAPSSPEAQVLTAEERRHLFAWIEDARKHGVDAAEDLRLRPWPVPVTAAVIGIFRMGEEMAAWLVVGQNGLWTVVAVDEGRVLATRPSLAEALALIHRPGSGPDRKAPLPWDTRHS
jgi:hypothetical protein